MFSVWCTWLFKTCTNINHLNFYFQEHKILKSNSFVCIKATPRVTKCVLFLSDLVEFRIRVALINSMSQHCFSGETSHWSFSPPTVSWSWFFFFLWNATYSYLLYMVLYKEFIPLSCLFFVFWIFWNKIVRNRWFFFFFKVTAFHGT